MRNIELSEFSARPFVQFDQDWALLVSGTERPNPMTVSWGGYGTLWHRPVLTVYVRRTRHTFACIETAEELTLSFLPADKRSALQVCGQISGRERDKWKAADIEPEPSQHVAVPRVKGALLAFECRVIGSVDIEPPHMRDKSLLDHYDENDFHRAYFSQVLAAYTANGDPSAPSE